ncbi:uncharacterized protein LOC119594572 [Penaeus monodon]|uniref:uncharacterized protein LOC119594572 n=1 Tax=Penaeus monodon TaxID=6687 RepID=UPI0018A7941F|nr:uncharacterized protein LOC119594572 [Penaeus monodon]
MKAAVRPRLFLLIWFLCFCLAQRDGDVMNYCAEGTLCAHQVDIPIDEVRRVVAVWFGDEYSGSVFGPGLWNSLLGVYGGMWYNYTATQRGSEYCVVPQARPKRETCDETTDSLSIIVSVDTKWDLQPVNLSSGCRRYYLLGLGLPVSDSPTRLLWWPGELADKLILGLGKSSVSSTPFTTFEKIESQPWYDITFQRGPNGYNCVVKSTTLNVSLTCRRDQTQPFFFRSLNHNDTSAPSFFSVNCEDTGIDWRVGVGAAFLLFISWSSRLFVFGKSGRSMLVRCMRTSICPLRLLPQLSFHLYLHLIFGSPFHLRLHLLLLHLHLLTA